AASQWRRRRTVVKKQRTGNRVSENACMIPARCTCSIGWHGGINLLCPRMNTAGQIDYSGKTIGLEEVCDAQAAHAVMADANDRCVAVQSLKFTRNRVHRDRDRAFDVAGLEFPWFTHIQQNMAAGGSLGDECSDFRRSQLLHGCLP